MVLLDPTYPFLYNLTELSGAEIVRASSPEFLFTAARSVNVGMTVLVNPNNPSGAWLPPERLSAESPHASVFVIDEAYSAFAPCSAAEFLERHPNWIIVRTFSKAYGLAGLRLGYAIADEQLIGRMALAQDPYPVSACAVAAGIAALDDAEYYSRYIAAVCTERARLTHDLRELGWTVEDSLANFVFAKPPQGDLTTNIDLLARAHILVRTFAHAQDGLRISVGLRAENDALIRTLSDVVGSPETSIPGPINCPAEMNSNVT